MTAATITKRTHEIMGTPGMEVVQLTATDGETYTANTLSRVDCASATFNEDMGTSTAVLSVALSDTVATIHASQATVTDKKVCLVLYGA